MLVLVADAQIPGQTGSQVGALYNGGQNARPRLNKASCASNNALVAVDFQVVVSVNPSFPTIPYGVLFADDVPIPAVNPNTNTTASGGVSTALVSAVTCAEPVQADIIQDNIPLLGLQLAFPMSQYNPSVPTVSDFMADLCNADGGVRTRRAYCFGVRNGQGATTTVRGGDGPDIDTIAPGVPSNIRAQSGDGYIEVTLGAPAGVDAVEAQNMTYVVQVRQCSPPDAGTPDAAVVTTDGGTDAGTPDAAVDDGPCGPFRNVGSAARSPVRVEDLQNGVQYEMRAYAIDDFGNEGPPSTQTVFANPVKEYGLLDLYGGEVAGFSCGQTRGGLGVVLLWALGWYGARRRRNSLGGSR